MKDYQFFALASNPCTDRSSKKEEHFYVRMVVDAMMATNFFSCQSLPSGIAQGIGIALKRSMAHGGMELGVGTPKLFLYCGDGASVAQGQHGAIIAILGNLQQQVARHDVVVPYHASCHQCDLAFKSALTSEVLLACKPKNKETNNAQRKNLFQLNEGLETVIDKIEE